MDIPYIVQYAVKRIEETHLTASEIFAHTNVFNRIAEQMCYVDGDGQPMEVYVTMLSVILCTIQEVA